ncbi:MAG: Hpt domain-containing protein [Flavobacteriales bacterium]|nr:Hpt domain-containing protein [Flavobacteriales bacterium]
MKTETKKYTDLTYLREVGDGDTDFIIDLIQTFLSVTLAHILELERLFNEGDWVEFKRMAHIMKPNAESMGIMELKEAYLKIDNLPPNDVGMFVSQEFITNLKQVYTESFIELEQDIKYL